MARGFLSGVLWGSVVGVGVSGAASVMAPAPMGPQVGDVAPAVAQSPDRIETASSGEAGSTADRALVTTTVAPQVDAPQQDSALSLDSDALTTPSRPVTDAPEGLADPDATADTASVAVQDEAAVIQTPQALAPMEPQAPDAVSVDTAPAAPVVVAEPTVPQTQAEGEAAIAAAVAEAREATQEETAQAEQAETPAGTAEETTAQVAPETEPAPEVVTEAETAPETEAVAVAEVPQETETAALAPQAQLEAVTPPSRVTESLEGVETAPTVPTEIAVPSGSARPRIGSPVGTIGDRDTGVTIRRPSSANLGEVDAGEPQEVAADAGTTQQGDDARPIRRFAQAFTPDADKPLMSIVLIDNGSSPVAGAAGIAALRGFPYPLSFAVDTSLTDAVERMNIYRKEGFEVLAMVDLPEGAQPSDAETAFGVILPQMTEVVGVLEGTAGGLQGSREVSDQVTSILLQTGHGLVARDKGLNTMPKLARKEGVPADPIFRDFDSKGQTADVIRRFLDQAAFKAGQEGAVVMLGRMRPDTVSALLLWGLQDRAGKVSLSPISAVLLRDQ